MQGLEENDQTAYSVRYLLVAWPERPAKHSITHIYHSLPEVLLLQYIIYNSDSSDTDWQFGPPFVYGKYEQT